MSEKRSTETASEPGPQKHRYILKQGQKHHLSTKEGLVTLKPGQFTMLTDGQFAAFKDKFDPADETKKDIEKRAEKKNAEKFSLESAGGRKFNVIRNSDNKTMTDEPITKTAATKLQKKLEADKGSDED